MGRKPNISGVFGPSTPGCGGIGAVAAGGALSGGEREPERRGRAREAAALGAGPGRALGLPRAADRGRGAGRDRRRRQRGRPAAAADRRARRAVTLIDLDPRRRAARGAGSAGRSGRRVDAIGHDVTDGAADAIVLAARADRSGAAAGRDDPACSADRETAAPARPAPRRSLRPRHRRPLLQPAALPGAGRPRGRPDRRAAALARHAPSLTAAVVARLHASAPLVVHVHDPLAWWDGHEQPVALEEILAAAAPGTRRRARPRRPRRRPAESDPRAALADLGLVPRRHRALALALRPRRRLPRLRHLRGRRQVSGATRSQV